MSANTLSAAEIGGTHEGNAYDAVDRLRPDFLRSIRQRLTVTERVVYLDGLFIGGVQELRTVPAGWVREVRLLSAHEATTRYGAGHSGGVLLVVTKAQP